MSKEAKVGLLVLCAGVSLYFGYHLLKGNDLFSREQVYYTRYSNVKGLQPSNSVLLNGVRVGQVKSVSIEHDHGDSVRVELSINSGLQVGDGTVLVLESAGLLDGMQLRLDLRPNTVLYEGDAYLEPYVDEGLMGKLSENGEVMQSVVHQVASLTDSNSHFRKTLVSILNSLDTTMSQTSSLMQNIDKSYARQQYNIEKIIKNLAFLTEEFKSIPKTAEATMQSVKALLDSLNATKYPELIAHLDSTMQNVEQLTLQMLDSSNSVGALFTQKELYNNMNQAMMDLDFVLIDFQANPSKYINVSVFGKQPDNEKPIIKNISPAIIDTEMVIKLKREVPASFELSLYEMSEKEIIALDPADYEIDRSSKTIRVQVPTDVRAGEYVLHATWLGASSGQSLNVTLK